MADEWKIIGTKAGWWPGSHHNKDGTEERTDDWRKSSAVVGSCGTCTDLGSGSERMWVSSTAPTSSHNETLFFCLAKHFLLRVFLALPACNLGARGSRPVLSPFLAFVAGAAYIAFQQMKTKC